MIINNRYISEEFRREIESSELFDTWLVRYGVAWFSEYCSLNKQEQDTCLFDFLDYYRWFRRY